MNIRSYVSKILCLFIAVLFSATASAGLTVTYYHNDVTGSPVAATNAAGEVIWRKTYTPYGEASGKDRDNKVGYTGHQEDANGLVFAGARYYDPALGRFLGVDPVGFSESNPMSFNRYSYANNNPYKYVDPDGRIVETVWDAANVVMDVSSMGMNLADGNYGAAAVDAAGLIFDGVATMVPFMPGGAGVAIKAGRAAGKAADAAKSGKATSKIDRGAFKKERESFWKKEAETNSSNYGADDAARMEKGKPPIGSDGYPMELHHKDRTMEGGLEPMSRTEHRLGENYKKNHPD